MNRPRAEIPTQHVPDEVRVTGARARPHPDDDITYEERQYRTPATPFPEELEPTIGFVTWLGVSLVIVLGVGAIIWVCS